MSVRWLRGLMASCSLQLVVVQYLRLTVTILSNVAFRLLIALMVDRLFILQTDRV